MELFSYLIGDHVLNAIDLTTKQVNYSPNFGPDYEASQRKMFDQTQAAPYFDRRVVENANFGTTIWDGGPVPEFLDGMIAREPNLPLFVPFGDCPQLMFAGRQTVGLVHATRDTIDKYILDIFADKFFKNEDPAETIVGFSPYIFSHNFSHEYLNLQREDEWRKAEVVYDQNGKMHIDLRKMAVDDLLRIGVDLGNILDHRVNNYDLSEGSVRFGGVAVSHRHAHNTGAQEGRSGMMIMLLEQ
ncbi:MAG: laccase domain-containing protein [Nanoarchaeota archaeon]|mgnify:CR=1 FL=1